MLRSSGFASASVRIGQAKTNWKPQFHSFVGQKLFELGALQRFSGQVIIGRSCDLTGSLGLNHTALPFRIYVVAIL
jgi:hypothetical protein